MDDGLSYSATGVDIDTTDAAKRRMADAVDSGDPRVLNQLGAFSSLVEGSFPTFADPVLVLKTDEPGSKQKLAFELDRVESLCEDLVNHLLNDVAVMAAHPQYVLDCIVCGQLDGDIVERLVAGMATACRAQEAVLVGGETSVQPGVVPAGLYVLSATAVGIAERAAVCDGSRIRPGDAVLAVASNGLHTNGYSLARKLFFEVAGYKHTQYVTAIREKAGAALMRTHRSYLHVIQKLVTAGVTTGMAHITGGGITENLPRILPKNIGAQIEIGSWPVLPIFEHLRELGQVSQDEMMRTFNMGIGLIAAIPAAKFARAKNLLDRAEEKFYVIGRVVKGERRVQYT